MADISGLALLIFSFKEMTSDQFAKRSLYRYL